MLVVRYYGVAFGEAAGVDVEAAVAAGVGLLVWPGAGVAGVVPESPEVGASFGSTKAPTRPPSAQAV
jgi:hypothetical protein